MKAIGRKDERCIAKLARRDARAATMMTCQTERERREEHRQRRYVDTYVSYVTTAIRQLP